jgi:hypothetical protein
VKAIDKFPYLLDWTNTKKSRFPHGLWRNHFICCDLMSFLMFFCKTLTGIQFPNGPRFIQRTEVHFASSLSDGFTTMPVINPPERKLAKCTSVQRVENH